MALDETDQLVSVRSLSTDDLQVGSAAAGIREVYADAFTGPPHNEPENAAASFVERLESESNRAGWKLLVAEQHGEISGFVYGYVTRPGQWWHDRVISGLEPELVQHWFSDSFVLVEFAVKRSARGKGVGTRLHDAVLDSLPQRTAVAMTHENDNPAVGFYRARGWQVIAGGLRFHAGDASRLILGKELLR